MGGLVAELFQKFGHLVVPEFQFPVLQAALQQFLAFCGLGELDLLELLANLVAGLAGDREIQPVGAWLLVLAGHYLHIVSSVEFLSDGHGLAVDLASGAAAAQGRVYVEGEVQHGGAGAQLPQFSARGEHEDVGAAR